MSKNSPKKLATPGEISSNRFKSPQLQGPQKLRPGGACGRLARRRLNHSATRDRRLRLATQHCYSRKAMMERELMAPLQEPTARCVSRPVSHPRLVRIMQRKCQLKKCRHLNNLPTLQCENKPLFGTFLVLKHARDKSGKEPFSGLVKATACMYTVPPYT